MGVPCFDNLESERPGGRKIAVLAPLYRGVGPGTATLIQKSEYICGQNLFVEGEILKNPKEIPLQSVRCCVLLKQTGCDTER